METRSRERGDMGLLNDITDELRGDDETDRGESEAATNARDDTAADRTPSSSESHDGTDRGETTDRDGGTTGRDGETTDGDGGDSVSDRDRDDGHVCSFCQTEFDADRGSCPECDAEIVLRGAK